jgi:hypothetical protein
VLFLVSFRIRSFGGAFFVVPIREERGLGQKVAKSARRRSSNPQPHQAADG